MEFVWLNYAFESSAYYSQKCNVVFVICKHFQPCLIFVGEDEKQVVAGSNLTRKYYFGVI
jgi:hypothetical protein